MNDLIASSQDVLWAFYDSAKAMALLAYSGELFLQLWILPGLVMGIGITVLSVAIRRKSAIEERRGHIVFPQPYALLDGFFIVISNIVLFPLWVLSWTATMLLWAANWPFQYLNFAMNSSAKWALEDVKKRRVHVKPAQNLKPAKAAPEKPVPAFADLVETPVFYTEEEIGKIKQVREMQNVRPKSLLDQSNSGNQALEGKRVH